METFTLRDAQAVVKAVAKKYRKQWALNDPGHRKAHFSLYNTYHQ